MNISVVSPKVTKAYPNQNQLISSKHQLEQSPLAATTNCKADEVCFSGSEQDKNKTPNAFTLAAQRNQVSELKRLGKDGVNDLDGRGMTPLVVATTRGHLEAMQVLCDELDADVDKPESHGHSPLMIAIIKGKLPAVQLLLAAGANPLAEDKKKQTALLYARKLLTNDKDPLRTDSKAILAAVKAACPKQNPQHSAMTFQTPGDFTTLVKPSTSELSQVPVQDDTHIVTSPEATLPAAELPDSPVFELADNVGLKPAGAHHALNGKQFAELAGDTGAAEIDSQPVYEMSHEARPVPTHINIEPDGFPLEEFQEQSNRANQPVPKKEHKLLKRLSGIFEKSGNPETTEKSGTKLFSNLNFLKSSKKD